MTVAPGVLPPPTRAVRLGPSEDALRFEAVLCDLLEIDAPHARLTRPEEPNRLVLLVEAETVSTVAEIVIRHGYRPSETPPTGRGGAAVYALRAASAADDDECVELRTELTYGTRSWLGTGEPERRILRRARAASLGDSARLRARRHIAAADELVDLVLHAVLDRRAFAPPVRRRLERLVEELRADPPAAGRAAERVQQELAPALTWSELLHALVHGRWEHLLTARRALERKLFRKAPLRSALRRLGLARRSAATRAPNGSYAEAPNPSPGEDSDAPPVEGAIVSSGDATPRHRDRPASDAVSRKQIRGSGLLLSGRGLSTGLKFLAELLIVRYLATADYGAWTYALSAVVSLRVIATLGLNRAVARYLPVHLERKERADFVGVTVLVFGGLLLAGGAVVAAFYAFPDMVARLAGAAPDQQLDLLFIVIFLVPIDMLDDFLTGLCAAFSKSRTIFVRRYLLSPILRIVVAVGLVLMESSVRVLAYGYLAAGVVGVVYYAWSVHVELRDRRLIDPRLLRRVTLPVKKVLSYTVPVMAADWCAVMLTTTGPLLLGYFTGMSAVALFQVVVPLVTLNKVVQQSFGVLYEPAASRLWARQDQRGLEKHYWSSAVWVAVLTFPLFAATFTAAAPLTVLLFSERYVAAAPILSILALGAFADCLLGFSAPTLRVAGRLRWLVGVNGTAAVVNVVLNALMIPTLGALGAAIATGISWILHVVLKQAALWRATGVTPFDAGHFAVYSAIALTTVGLVAVRVLVGESLLTVVPLTVVASAIVFLAARRSLDVSATFPELGRYRAVRVLFG